MENYTELEYIYFFFHLTIWGEGIIPELSFPINLWLLLTFIPFNPIKGYYIKATELHRDHMRWWGDEGKCGYTWMDGMRGGDQEEMWLRGDLALLGSLPRP